ncbi:MAG TPA: hypothetical protein VK590_10500, partial [Saprospiraceae bacterium]|nr:hypothetical protein [Saprospiraceae bacterium]
MSTEKKESTEVAVVTAFDIKKEDLTKLAEDYGKLVVSAKTLEDCDTARKLLKTNRTGLQGTQKARAKSRLDWKRKEDEKDDKLVEELLKIIHPIELRLEKEINVIKEAQQKEAAAKLKLEEDRRKQIKDKIRLLDNQVVGIRSVSTIKELEDLEDEVQMEKDSFEEFNEEGNRSIETLVQVIGNRKIVVQSEIEAAAALEKIKSEVVEKSHEEVIEEHSARMEEETILHEEGFNGPVIFSKPSEKAYEGRKSDWV